jgi:hypothetical protein
MKRIASALLCAGFVAGCARTPAPADAAAAPPAQARPITEAPPKSGKVTGAPCWVWQHDRGPAPTFLPDTPTGVAVRFYELHQPHAGAGVPDAADLETYRPLLTRPLIAALERARAERDAAVASAPDEKPPYVEGALFASLFEGYTSVQPITLATEGWEAQVKMCFAYAQGGDRTEWTDTVKLRKEDGTWRIDDVVYGGQWDFANTGSLRAQLPAQ